MANFSELQTDCYYLLQENEHSRIVLVFVQMATEKCVLIEYQDEDQTTEWFRKSDTIFEIIEQLTEAQAVEYENIVDDESDDEDPELDWDDMDDDLNSWFGEDDDSDNDEKIRALNN